MTSHVLGKVVTSAWSDPHPRFSDGEQVLGRRVEAVVRRGKYLLLSLDDGTEMVVHLGMTGVLQVAGPEIVERHLRGRWEFDDGTVLVLHDPRKFGRVTLVRAGEYEDLPTLSELGPEPLEEDFTPEGFGEALGKSRANVKSKLLSQRIVAGVGNIYADEALWAARIHPQASSLGTDEVERLHRAVRDALESGIERRGTTLRDYRTADGTSGENQHSLLCYGRAGEPCSRCGTLLVSSRVAGRGTTHCPACQVLRTRAGGDEVATSEEAPE